MTRPVIPSLGRQTGLSNIARRRKRGLTTRPARSDSHERISKPDHPRSKHSISHDHQPDIFHTSSDAYSITSSRVPHSPGTQAKSHQDGNYESRCKPLPSEGLTQPSRLSGRSESIASTTHDRQMTRPILPQKLNPCSSPPILRQQDETVPVSPSLVPLSEARDLGSFDLVLRRSSSIHRTTSFTPKQHPNPAKTDRGARGNSTRGRNKAAPVHHSTLHSPPGSGASARSIHGSVGQPQDLDGQRMSGLAGGVDESSIHRRLLQHRFTIDEQVELESTSNDRGGQPVETSDVRMRSACETRLDSEIRVSPGPMTSESHRDPRAFDLTDPSSITSHFGDVGSTTFSFATRPGNDSPAWQGPIISSDLISPQSDFSFSAAPQICPREQTNYSLQPPPAYGAVGTPMSGPWDNSGVIEATDIVFQDPLAGKNAMFASVPRSQTSEADLGPRLSSMERRFDKPSQGASMCTQYAGDVWISDPSSTGNPRNNVHSIRAPLWSRHQPIAGLKRKADTLSETNYPGRESNSYFQPPGQCWPMHENFSEVMLCEPVQHRYLETGDRKLGPEEDHVTVYGYPASSRQGGR